MITGKIVANAGSHRILAALSDRPRDIKDLKNVVGAINSLNRFEGEYMGRLEQAGYAVRRMGMWHITNAGKDKLEQLGLPSLATRPSVAGPRRYYMDGNYEPEKDARPMRPGSQDFLQYPSRIGHTRRYRDGRVEQIKEYE